MDVYAPGVSLDPMCPGRCTAAYFHQCEFGHSLVYSRSIDGSEILVHTKSEGDMMGEGQERETHWADGETENVGVMSLEAVQLGAGEGIPELDAS